VIEMLHRKMETQKQHFRKEELEGWVAGFTYDSSKGEGEIY